MNKNHGLRPELSDFVEAMEAKLEKNDHKPDWEQESLDYLKDRLMDEVQELSDAFDNFSFSSVYHDNRNIADEAVDVANFAMMIYSKVKKGKMKKVKPPQPTRNDMLDCFDGMCLFLTIHGWAKRDERAVAIRKLIVEAKEKP